MELQTREAVIVAARRTPIGKMGGKLSRVEPEVLAAEVIKSILKETQLSPLDIDEVILGNAAGPGGNIARLAWLQAGLPFDVPAVTVDRQCASGLEAINVALERVLSGAGDIYLAGGVESTSRAPWRIEKPRSLYDIQPPRLYTRARFSPSFVGDPEMGEAAENVAEAFRISREDQDEYALESHRKAIRAKNEGRFEREIVPTHIREGQAVVTVTEDECPRADTSMEKLRALPPVFRENGTVTAGNACPLNDGAAIVLVMSVNACRERGLQPLLKYLGSAAAGVDPRLLGIGPVPAVKKLLAKRNLDIRDVDLVEFNEAFASQTLASLRELKIPPEKVNRGGGAIALGHPYGASGAILVTRLCTEMPLSDANTGLAALGIGGGLGLASLFQRVR